MESDERVLRIRIGFDGNEEQDYSLSFSASIDDPEVIGRLVYKKIYDILTPAVRHENIRVVLQEIQGCDALELLKKPNPPLDKGKKPFKKHVSWIVRITARDRHYFQTFFEFSARNLIRSFAEQWGDFFNTKKPIDFSINAIRSTIKAPPLPPSKEDTKRSSDDTSEKKNKKTEETNRVSPAARYHSCFSAARR
jgi:hypothetical protein